MQMHVMYEGINYTIYKCMHNIKQKLKHKRMQVENKNDRQKQ